VCLPKKATDGNEDREAKIIPFKLQASEAAQNFNCSRLEIALRN
jgi:hypothetical protein